MHFRYRLFIPLLLANVCSIAQSASSSNEELRAVVIVARHGVRTPIESETRFGVFNAQPWPDWPTPPGMLTPHGIDALKRMGEFYKRKYGALAGCQSVRVESTNTPRTIASAKVVISTVVPGCDVQVQADLAADPPSINKGKLSDAINGRMADEPEWFTHAFARPLAEMHDVLTHCRDCKGVPDFRAMMLQPGVEAQGMMQAKGTKAGALVPRDAGKENAVALGADFAENFLLEYTEGKPMNQVGWGSVDRATLDDLMEMNTRYHDFILRTPYYAQQAAGTLAKKISRILSDAASHPQRTASEIAPGVPASFTYLSAHDANLTWLGGLLRMNWIVSDETINATPPGSALVFELHCATLGSPTDAPDSCTVRTMFVAQTLDQIRNLTSLTGAEKPSIAPVYVPGCSGPGPEYACSAGDFAGVVDAAQR
jgi:4-phytase/acid phosphatase